MPDQDPSSLQAEAVRSARNAFNLLPASDEVFQQCLRHRDPVKAIVDKLSAEHSRFKWKKSARLLQSFQQYTQWLQNIASVVDVVVQTQAGIGCPLWAPMKFLLQISNYHAMVTDATLKMIRAVSDDLPRFELYGNLGSDPLLRAALLNVFTEIVSFCATVLKFIRRGFIVRLTEVIISSIAKDLDESLIRLRDRARVVDSTALAVELSKARQFREHQGQTRQSQLDTLQSFKTWLGLTDSRDHYHRLLAAKAKGTTGWIWTQALFLRWKCSSQTDPSSRLLGIVGKHGCGKSILAAAICNSLDEISDSSAIFFSFSRIEAGHHSLEHLTRVLLLRVLESLHNNEATELMQDLIQYKKTSAFEISNALHKALALVKGNLFLVIDGVDECKDDSSKLVEYVSGLLECHTTARALMIGRTQSLNGTSNIITIIPEMIGPDIENFLRLEIDRSQSWWDAGMKDLIFRHISTGADGMFLWGGLVLNDLRRANSKFEVRERLRRLPRGLEQTYNHLLLQLTEDLDGSEIELASTILRLITVSCRRLTLDEISYACALKSKADSEDSNDYPLTDYLLQDPAKTVARVCRGFITIDNDTVGLVHISALEFLTGQGGAQATKPKACISSFKVEPVEANRMFAILCLNYLEWVDFGFPLEEVKSARDYMAGHPFLEYASVFMISHFSHSGKLDSITGQRISQFMCSSKCIAWLELYACLIFSESSTGTELSQVLPFAAWLYDKVDLQSSLEPLIEVFTSQKSCYDLGIPLDDSQAPPQQMTYAPLCGNSSTLPGSVDLMPVQSAHARRASRFPMSPKVLLRTLQRSEKLSSQWHVQCFLTGIHHLTKLKRIGDPLEDLFRMIVRNASKISAYLLLAIILFYCYFDEYEKALELCEVALRKVQDCDTPLKHLTQTIAGAIHCNQDQYDTSVAYLEEALAGVISSFGENHFLSGLLLQGIGLVHQDFNNFEDAVACQFKAYNILDANPKFPFLGSYTTKCADSLCYLSYQQEESTKMLAWAKNVYKRNRKSRGDQDYKTIESSYWVGLAYKELNQTDDSLTYFTIAYTKRDNDRVPKWVGWRSASHMSGIYHDLGNLESDLKWALEAVKLIQNSPSDCTDPKSTWYVGILSDVGHVYYMMSDYERAIEWFAKSEEISAAFPDSKRTWTYRLMWLRGNCEVCLGNYLDGIKRLTRAYEGFVEIVGPHGGYTTGALEDMSIAYGDIGCSQGALHWLQRAYHTATQGPQTQDAMFCLIRVAEIYELFGRWPEACMAFLGSISLHGLNDEFTQEAQICYNRLSWIHFKDLEGNPKLPGSPVPSRRRYSI